MKTAIIALGGNAISPPGEQDTIHNQFHHTRQSLDAIINLLKGGILPVITHGNGPQVGNAALRTEITSDQAPYLPLGINVADTEGGMGYMIEQSLQNRLKQEGIERQVVTLVTQVRVDLHDPSITDPTKYIGPLLPAAEAGLKVKDFGWIVKEVEGGWRRVVPSPEPLEIVNAKVIQQLLELGHIVIAAGGGGVPAYYDEDGNLEGLDAVIDKDKASALLGSQVKAELLYILTNVDRVALNFGEENEQDIARMNLSEAKVYLDEGHFPPGNMGPKVEAAIQFLESGGHQVVITSLENIMEDATGSNGTIIENE